ncbi:MAG: hypothetical protein HZB31_04070 [Nitrospirae bacterium]|nr:hypothetical protein [Nitrospirota bacterium]
MADTLEELKKQVFYDLLNIAGRVYIAVRYGEDVVVGKRGFLPQEREKGLILVFNQKMNFIWDEFGISTTLAFGTTAEKCFIPQESIFTIFSPELNAQFTVDPGEQTKVPEKKAEKKMEIAGKKTLSDKKVISVDFKKKL